MPIIPFTELDAMLDNEGVMYYKVKSYGQDFNSVLERCKELNVRIEGWE